jgi:omega-6 fatty acid desaturase (delta-12 desaturase)
VVGMILHSFLLVPFYSWKFSHAAHHGATNHLRKDQVFVPPTREEAKDYQKMFELLEDTPILNLVLALRMFLIGWPAYLAINTSGQESQVRFIFVFLFFFFFFFFFFT